MPAILTAIGGILGVGGFAAFPWGTHSSDRVILAVVLWATGLIVILAAAVLERRNREESKAQSQRIGSADSPDSGPMVIAESLVNHGTIAHTVTPSSQPTISPIQQRAELRRRIGNLLQQGDKISMSVTRDLLMTDAIPWQKNVANLLSSALVDQDPTTYFVQLGPGDWTHIVVVVRDQLQYLREINESLDMFDIKEFWQG
jgi:hypothetical protein